MVSRSISPKVVLSFIMQKNEKKCLKKKRKKKGFSLFETFFLK